jgi:hypothetical protein
MSLLLPALLLLFGAFTPDLPENSPVSPALVAQQDGGLGAALANATMYYVGIYTKGPKWTSESDATIQERFATHQKELLELVKNRKLVGMIRTAEPSKYWGLIFYKGDTQQDVMSLAAGMKVVEEGILSFALVKMWAAKGMGEAVAKEGAKKGKIVAAPDTMYLVAFSKGEKWTGTVNEEVRQKLTRQFEYMSALRKSGVARFGCMADSDTDQLRGIWVLATKSEGEARMEASNSPAVKEKWFHCQVVKVVVPRGMLP